MSLINPTVSYFGNTRLNKVEFGGTDINKTLVFSYPTYLATSSLVYQDSQYTISYPGSGSIWYSIKNSNDTGSATLVNTTFTSSEGINSFVLNGVDSYISYSSPLIPSNLLTSSVDDDAGVMMWIKYDEYPASGSYYTLASIWRTNGGFNLGTFKLQLDWEGRLRVITTLNGSGSDESAWVFTGDPAIWTVPTGSWTLVGGYYSYDLNTVRINNQQPIQNGFGSGYKYPPSWNAIVGMRGDNVEHFKGQIANVHWGADVDRGGAFLEEQVPYYNATKAIFGY